MSYAAAEATLKLYLEPEKLEETHPVLHMITEKPESVKRRTQTLRRWLAPDLKDKAELSVIPGATEMGSGSLPGETIPTFVLQMKLKGISPDDFGKKLRLGRPPVFSRIAEDAVLFDLRTVFKGQERLLGESIKAAF
jgi:L-seryl-tRNA(Ser) seleniumtransferase